MTETKRIRWTDALDGEALGYVGGLDRPAFRLWPPDEEGDRVLLVYLAGSAQHMYHDDSEDSLTTLKAKAELLLEEFVSSLGAVFPDQAYDFGTPGDRPVEVLFAPGRRVRFEHPENGYPGDGEQAAKCLTRGEVYVIAWSDIGFANTRLGLVGVTGDRGQGFNSVLFEPVDDEETGQ
jgi:hypothetical protein